MHYHLYTTFGGHHPFKTWEGKMRPKFGAILDYFWLCEYLQNRSRYKNRKQTLLRAIPAALNKIDWWTLVH